MSENDANVDEETDGESNNRTFFIVALVLGCVILFSLCLMAILTTLYSSGMNTVRDGTREAIVIVYTRAALIDQQTQEAALNTPTLPPTYTPTLPPTETPVVVFATSTPSSGPTQTHNAALGTIEALMTQLAIAQMTPTAMPSVTPTITPNPTQVLQSAFVEIDNQFSQTYRSNIVYIAPQEMTLDETIAIELLLNPVLSVEELSTEVINQGNLVTSTAQPGELLTKQGGRVDVVASNIKITNQMKAVLKPINQNAFDVQELHDNPVQVVSLKDTTKWRWSVTAKKEGVQVLELIVFQLVKYGGEDYWHEVKAYNTNIQVKVTPWQWFITWDWKWLLGFIIPGILASIWGWFVSRKKKSAKSTELVKKRYKS
jgi:hypothetical protein